VEVSRVQFIPPALSKLRSSPPTGDAWQFEVKFDGWRVQLHKAGVSSTIYGKNGGDTNLPLPADCCGGSRVAGQVRNH
jgi:bifunctional non-homologous end joining protein LigD